MYDMMMMDTRMGPSDIERDKLEFWKSEEKKKQSKKRMRI